MLLCFLCTTREDTLLVNQISAVLQPPNNGDLIQAIQSAGVERGHNGFLKNKSMQKQPESEEDF